MSQPHTAEKDAACRKGPCYSEFHIKAGKNHRCAWCGGVIPVGSDHVVATEFPGGEAGYADHAGHPVRMRIHSEPPCHYHGEGRVTPPAVTEETP